VFRSLESRFSILAIVVRILRMSTIDAVLAQLKQQRDALNNAIAALEGVSSNGSSVKRTLSASARARIATAQRARWAKAKGQKAPTHAPKKRKMSSAVIAKIRVAQKARWARFRKQKKAV
jgi:hypothetical protein